MKSSIIAAMLFSLGFITTVGATEVKVDMQQVTGDGIGNSVGEITITETPYGLLFTPNLQSLPVGVHGFHIHENASCAPTEKEDVKTAAGAAGGHLDPDATGKHLGPYNDQGHLGDLPAVYVAQDGTVTYPVLAPRFKTLSQIDNKALMIHVGSDNHDDNPLPLGGGGTRMVCGVINIK